MEVARLESYHLCQINRSMSKRIEEKDISTAMAKITITEDLSYIEFGLLKFCYFFTFI